MSSILRKRSFSATEFPSGTTLNFPACTFIPSLEQLISKNQEKYYASLRDKKCRDREQKFLVEGVRLCEELLDSALNVEAVVFAATLVTTDRARNLIERFRESGALVSEASRFSLQKISQTVHSQGILAVANKPCSDIRHLMSQEPQTLVALSALNDPGNLGTILRSAAWFGLDGVLLGENSVEATNPKVVRGSMGALFHLPIAEAVELPQALADLKEVGYRVTLADARGDTVVQSAVFGAKNVIILGGETTAVAAESRNLADAVVSIPRIGTGDSLNVAVAAGILFSEFARRKS